MLDCARVNVGRARLVDKLDDSETRGASARWWWRIPRGLRARGACHESQDVEGEMSMSLDTMSEVFGSVERHVGEVREEGLGVDEWEGAKRSSRRRYRHAYARSILHETILLSQTIQRNTSSVHCSMWANTCNTTAALLSFPSFPGSTVFHV